MGESTIDQTSMELVLLKRLNMTVNEAKAGQIRHHNDSLWSYLVTVDRENNLAELQKLYDEVVGVVSRNGYPHQMEVEFITKFRELEVEFIRRFRELVAELKRG